MFICVSVWERLNGIFRKSCDCAMRGKGRGEGDIYFSEGQRSLMSVEVKL